MHEAGWEDPIHPICPILFVPPILPIPPHVTHSDCRMPSHPIPSIPLIPPTPHSSKPMPCTDVPALTAAPLIHPQHLHCGHMELH